jgi:hypothetical protein
MKKNVLALSIAAMVCGAGFVGGASAAVFNVPTGDTKPTTGRALAVNPDGIGHILVIPYFTTQNGNATLISLTNTDTANNPALGGFRAKAVKVRFRGASNSDDIFDFQVFLSPGDVWTANISKGADGRSVMNTQDKSCTLPASVNQPFVVDRLPGDAAAKNAGTLEGYIEIFNMADIPSLAIATPATGAYHATNANPLYTAVKHVNGVAPCTAATFAPLFNDPVSLTALRTLGMDAPTTGLMGSWTIVNLANAAAFAANAEAIQAIDTTLAGNPAGVGNAVFFPQAPTTVADANPFTADPVLRTNIGAAHSHVLSAIDVGLAGARTSYVPAGGLTLPVVQPALYDLPDLSTPYIEHAGDVLVSPIFQASSITGSLALRTVKNEFSAEASIAGGTDWTFSMPTRRYSVGVDYRPTTPVRVFTDLTPGATAPAPDDALANDYFITSNTSFNALDKNQVCVNAGAINLYDREENTPAGAGFVISPGVPTTLSFCGEVSVLTFNAAGSNSVLGSKIAVKDITSPYSSGWADIAIPGVGFGLPIRGASFLKAASGASNFGANYDHRGTR